MRSFFLSLPAAATSSYALVAYAICGALFLFRGAKVAMLRSVLRKIKDVPRGERRHVIESVTNSVLPTAITAEEWIRNNRNRWVYLLCGALIVCASAVATVAVTMGPIA